MEAGADRAREILMRDAARRKRACWSWPRRSRSACRTTRTGGRGSSSNLAVHPDYTASVRAALAPLGEQAIIEEQRPFAEVKAAYERAAIAVVPSKWEEPFGRTALEAHAGGAALISSGTGGLAEVSGNAALILPEVSADAIGTALDRLVGDEALRVRLAEAGAKRRGSISTSRRKPHGWMISTKPSRADKVIRGHALRAGARSTAAGDFRVGLNARHHRGEPVRALLCQVVLRRSGRTGPPRHRRGFPPACGRNR